jgi:hypothetical protein
MSRSVLSWSCIALLVAARASWLRNSRIFDSYSGTGDLRKRNINDSGAYHFGSSMQPVDEGDSLPPVSANLHQHHFQSHRELCLSSWNFVSKRVVALKKFHSRI